MKFGHFECIGGQMDTALTQDDVYVPGAKVAVD